jgi:hypothetical protein
MQAELDHQVSANESMQLALAESADGKTMSSLEIQAMIARHSQEMEELRTSSETKIARLERELDSAHQALSADQDVLQDKVQELEENVREQGQKLIEAYKHSEELEEELKKAGEREVRACTCIVCIRARIEVNLPLL